MIGVKVSLNDSDNTTGVIDTSFYLDDVHWDETSGPLQYNFNVLQTPIEQMDSIFANFISVIPRWFMDTGTSNTIYFDSSLTPSDSLVELTISMIHDAGMYVMLKPHVDVKDGTWRNAISPSNTDLWYDQYEAFITYYADIAAANGVDMFCLGTELDSMAAKDPTRWAEIIYAIQAILPDSAALTYAANWDDYNLVTFFYQDLDYFGLDAYFPLTTEANPSLASLIASWDSCLTQLDSLYAAINKPIIFTEIGYSSRDFAAADPWHNCTWGDTCQHEANPELQALCYQAVFEVFSDSGAPQWFEGLFWWNWEVYADAGGLWDRNFTPQWKPAEDILRENFGLITPTIQNLTITVSNNDIILKWENIVGTLNYKIFYSDIPYFTPTGMPQTIIPPPDTSWTDVNAVNQGKRYYRVVVEY